MKTNSRFLMLLIAIVVNPGCGAPTTTTTGAVSPLVVTSFFPRDVMDDRDETIRIQFDRPVVGEDEVGISVARPPVAIEPTAELAAMWDDRQTLVISVVDELEPSTRYTVKLTGDISERIDDEEFSFVYKPLELEKHFGVNLRWTDTMPRIGLVFNQPVRAADLSDMCVIESEFDRSRIPVDTADDALTGQEMVLSPSRELEQGRWYTLVCDGLSGTSGDVAMESSLEIDFRTRPVFEVVIFGPEGDDVWSDEVNIEIEFSTPVDGEKLKKVLRSRPKIAGLDKGTLDLDGTRYRVMVDLKSSTDYKVSFGKPLTDIFSQSLGDKFTRSFTTGQARPRLVMETGIFAVETANKGGAYPVWTKNLSRFDVTCARVPKRKVVGLLTGSMNYDPWYDAGDNSDLDWKKLGLKKKKRNVKIREARDKWHLSNIRFDKLCGGGKGKGKGLFMAEMNSDQVKLDEDYPWRYHPRKRVLANLTDLGVLVKAGSAAGLVWVTGLSDGAPVEAARVTVYTPRGRKAFSGTTDSDGILRVPGADELLRQDGAGDKDDHEDEWGYDEYDTWRSRRLIVVVEKGADMAVVDGNWSNGIQIWNFGVTADYRGGETRLRGFILSDRGIYRPGETVHFKGLIRQVALGKSPSVPDNARVALHVEDSRGSTVLERSVRLSQYGGFGFDLKLGKESSLGDYYVTATVKGRTFRESFIVEEFKKVTYELKMSSKKRHTRLGKKLRFDLTADYLFGASVSNADIEWTVSRRPHHLHFPDHEQYTFADDAADGWSYWWWERDDNSYMSFVSDGGGLTDERGRYGFTVRDEVADLKGPQDYVIQVTAQDQTGETVSKRMAVTAHRSDVYVGLHAQEWVQAVGMPFSVNTIALSPKGEQLPLKARLSYVRQRQVCTHKGRYRSNSTCEVKHDKVWSRIVDIPGTGTGTERIMPKEPGEYVIRLDGEDSAGNKVSASRFVWVLGKGEAFWSGDESARMSLVAGKSKYEPGELAKLAPRSSLGPSTALVTLERNGIIDAFVKKMDSAGQGIEVPVKEAYAPNLFVSVSMVKGRTGEGDRHRPRFQMGIVELDVTTRHQRLDIDIKMDRKSYEPGQKVNAVIKVLSGGKPVKSEIAVSVADEGVLSLIGYKTPDPMKTFYKAWGLGVDNATNLNRISRLNDPRVIDPDEGGDSGDGGGSDVRSRFVSSAFWASSLETDERGEVEFSFIAPDNLTAFRVMAVAADTGAKFGSGEKRFTVKKPLLLRPLLPRFISMGDRIQAGVEIRNLTGRGGKAEVTVSARGCKMAKRKMTVEISRGGSAVVRFPATALTSGHATFTFRVSMEGHSDAVKIKIPVERPMALNKKVLSRGNSDGKSRVALSWGDEVIEKESRLEVTVDRTGLSELAPSLRYLVEYPYGCLEQTLSRLIPLLKVKDLAGSMDIKDLKGPRLRKFIKLGLAKVVRHQHDDGHFSLWPGGGTYPHLTVYALFGLSEAKRAGVKVDEDAIARGVVAVRRWANGKGHSIDSPGEGGTLAMAAYVLAELGQADTGLNVRLFEKRAGLPVYGKAFALSAIEAQGGSKEEMRILEKDILSELVSKGGVVKVRERSDMRRYMSSDVRSSAIVLAALLRFNPKNKKIPGLVEGLRREQKPGGYWGSTQDNSYALVALADYARAMKKGNLHVTLRLNGKKLVARRLNGNQILSFSRPLRSIERGDLEIETDGRARHSVRLVLAASDDRSRSVDRGFSLKREYLDPRSGERMTRFRVGDLVRVKVTVETPKDRAYVAVVDRLPAGFEAVNTRLATSVQDPRAQESRDRWYWRPGWTHTELKDDRVLAFADRMVSGELEMTYLARAVTPGTFTAAPAGAEAMYEPEVNGRTVSRKVEVGR